MQELPETQVRSLGQGDPPEEEMASRSSFLPGESHGQRSLAGCSSWGRRELDVTEHAQIVPVGVVQPHFLRAEESEDFLQGGCCVCQ